MVYKLNKLKCVYRSRSDKNNISVSYNSCPEKNNLSVSIIYEI